MKLTALLAFVAVFSLAGCGSDAPQPAPGSTPARPAAATAAAPAVRNAGAEPRVTIRPERLRSIDTALATVAGCAGSVRYAWSVNGEPVAGVAADRLSPEHFRRDDEVSVEVQCNGKTTAAATRVANSPPRVTLVKFQNPVVTAGKEIVALPEAFDPDGDTAYFEYQWIIDGTEVMVTDRTLPGSFVKTGSQIVLNVIATDGDDRNTPYWGEPFVVESGPPRITSQPPKTFQGLEYLYQVKAVDPDGDRLTYRLEEAPAGMAINAATGLLTWTIAPGTVGEFGVKIVVKDTAGYFARQEYSLSLKRGE